MTPHLAEAAVTLSQSAELSLLIKATVVIGVGLIAARVAVHARASVRHLLLAATFASALALPLAARSAPEIVIGVPVASSVATPAPASAAPAGAQSRSAGAHAESRGAISWIAIIRAGWIAGTTVFLAPLALVLWRLRRLRRTGLPWREAHDAIQSLAADAGVNRPVDVLLHEGTPSPLTFGTRHPVIVLPPDARGWEDADLRRAVVHELEHVKRGDWAVQVAARAICAVYWFHPLVWVAWRRLSLEAERACDDAVVTKEESMEYAEQLVALAERLSAVHAQPTLGMAHRSDLSARVTSLLDPGQRRGRAGIGAAAAAIGAAVLMVATVAPVRAVATRVEINAARTTEAPASEKGTGQGRRQRGLDRELYEAAAAADIEGINELLAAGANVNAAIDGDGSPLIAAALTGRLDVARLLLDKGADPNQGVEGDGSPLIAAATSGRTEMVALLLDRGAQVDQVVPGDENPLIQACGEGHLAVVQLLVARGADVNTRVHVVNVRGEDEWRTPLGSARRGRHAAVVAFLTTAGARD